MGVNSVTKVSTDTPIEKLVSYSVKRDSMPLNPTENSAAIPSASFQIAVPEGQNPEDLMGEQIVLSDRQGIPIYGDVVDYNLSEGTNVASLDTVGLFDKLNTEQTCLPYIYTGDISIARVLASWAQECGVFRYQVPGIPRTYITNRLEMGYQRDSNERWILAETDTYRLTFNGKSTAPFLGPSQPIMFGTSFSGNMAGTNFVSFHFPQNRGPEVVLRLERSGSTARLLQTNAAGSLAVLGTLTLPVEPDPTTSKDFDVHVLAQVSPSTPNRVDYSLRAITRGADVRYTTANFAHTTGSVLLGTGGYNKITQATPAGTELWIYFGDGSVLPTKRMNAQFEGSFTDTLPPSVRNVQGFTGNVWSAMKEFCSIYRMNLSLDNDTLQITPMLETSNGSAVIRMPPKSNVRKSLSKRSEARKVEVVYNKLRGFTGTNQVLLWKADTVYSLEKGETKVEVIDSDATFIGMMQPMPLAGIPNPLDPLQLSSYVITGNDGYIVDPNWWVDNGGSIKVAPTRKSGQIEITMQAPTVDSVRAPYRVSEGTADRPALYISGNGVVKIPSTVEIYTGSPDAAQEVGVTFDSPFVTDMETVYRVGATLATYYGGTMSDLGYVVALNAGHEGLSGSGNEVLGRTPETAHVYHRGAVFRSISSVSNPNSLQVSAEDGTTVTHFKDYWASNTVAQLNTYFAGKKVKDFNRAPLKQHLS